MAKNGFTVRIDALLGSLAEGFEPSLCVGDLVFERFRCRCELRNLGWIVPCAVTVPHARECRLHAVVILVADRVELVVMATSAMHGQAEKRRSGSHDHVVEMIGAFLRFASGVLDADRIVRACYQESGRRLDVAIIRRKLVAGQLLQDHAAKRLVFVERADDPVSVRPSVAAQMILLVAIALAETRDVQPVPPPALSVGGRCEQAVDQFDVGFRIVILDERVHFRRPRRKSGQVEAQSSY